MSGAEIRELGAEDIETLLAWREEVLAEVFAEERPWDEGQLLEANRRYYAEALASGGHRAFVASLDGADAGCGAVCFQRELPSPDNPSGICAYLMNVYTKPEARHRGVAEAMVEALVCAAREHGAGKIYLEATEAGRPVYEKAGFEPLDGMMKLTARKEG